MFIVVHFLRTWINGSAAFLNNDSKRGKQPERHRTYQYREIPEQVRMVRRKERAGDDTDQPSKVASRDWRFGTHDEPPAIYHLEPGAARGGRIRFLSHC